MLHVTEGRQRTKKTSTYIYIVYNEDVYTSHTNTDTAALARLSQLSLAVLARSYFTAHGDKLKQQKADGLSDNGNGE